MASMELGRWRGLGVAAALLGGACNALGASEADARVEIEKDGLADIEIKQEGNTFEFTGTKGDELCKGSITIDKGIGSKSFRKTMKCSLDTRACKPGAAAACNKLADKLYAAEEKVFPTAAADLYRTACADGDAHACNRVGEYEVIEKNWPKVREFSKKACDLKQGDACNRLAVTELKGDGAEKNEANAIALFKRGCELGALHGCRGAAGLLIDAEPSDPAAALPLAEKACTAKLDDGCAVLGVALFRLKKDYVTALRHLEAGCEGPPGPALAAACNLAGAIYADGLGMPRDPAKALPLFERACEKAASDGCVNAGNAHKNGRGTPRDPAKAAELFAKACELGSKEHCAK